MAEQRQAWRNPTGAMPGGGSVEGLLVPEVMLQLYRQSHSGEVRFAITGGEWFVLRFAAGRPLRLVLSSSDRARREVLADCLPPEQLAFALRHSQQQGLDPITGALQLALLPPADEPRLRRAVVLRVGGELTRSEEIVQVDCGPSEASGETLAGETLAGETLAGARSAGETSPGGRWAAPDPEYLGLILALLGQVSTLDFYRRRLASTWRERLVLCSDAEVLRRVEGSLHQVVVALRKGPESPEGLLAREGATADDVVRAVYVLRATGLARSEVLMSSPAPRWSKAPGGASEPGGASAPGGSKEAGRSGELAATVARPASAISGVRKLSLDAGLPARPSVRSPAQAPSDEHLVEAAALEAWMRAVADPALQQKALVLTQRAATRFPNNPRILFYLGCAYAQNGRPGAAAGALRHVLELDPDHVEAGRELALLERDLAGNSPAKSRFSFGADPTKKVR